MSLFRNRTVLGILCIAVSLIICFAITPLVNRGLSSKTEIVRMKKNAQAGEQITKDMVEVVSVGKYNLPSNVCKSESEVVGKYLTAELYDGDYILSSKLSEDPAMENAYLYSLNGTKQAISITISRFAEGLSGKLKSGDIVSVIVPDYEGKGETVIPAELKYVEVIAVTAKSGNDANTSDTVQTNSDEEEGKELPSTVTILVTPEQSKLLAELEAEYDMHLSLVYRGSRESAALFIEAQDKVLENKKLAKEALEKWAVAESLGFTFDADGDGIFDTFEYVENDGTTGNEVAVNGSAAIRTLTSQEYAVYEFYYFADHELTEYVTEYIAKKKYGTSYETYYGTLNGNYYAATYGSAYGSSYMGSGVVDQAGAIIASPLPANASLGSSDVEKAGSIVNGN